MGLRFLQSNGGGGGFPPGGDLSFPVVRRELKEGTILFVLLNGHLQLYGDQLYIFITYVIFLGATGSYVFTFLATLI